MAAYVKGRTSPSAAGKIVAGDLNSAPDTLEMALFKVGEGGGRLRRAAVELWSSGLGWRSGDIGGLPLLAGPASEDAAATPGLHGGPSLWVRRERGGML
jgi:hypothetical protein